jgi:hypothetical protein
MRRVFAVITFGAALAALGAFACGPGSDKPPLTPDTEHSPTEITEGGAPAPAPSNPIVK